MTLQEAKNQVAKNNGWDDWNHILFSERSQESKDILFTMAAELYARSKWDEACEETIEDVKCRIGDEYRHIFFKPPFKP